MLADTSFWIPETGVVATAEAAALSIFATLGFARKGRDRGLAGGAPGEKFFPFILESSLSFIIRDLISWSACSRFYAMQEMCENL